jgi:hypothetical protein
MEAYQTWSSTPIFNVSSTWSPAVQEQDKTFVCRIQVLEEDPFLRQLKIKATHPGWTRFQGDRCHVGLNGTSFNPLKQELLDSNKKYRWTKTPVNKVQGGSDVMVLKSALDVAYKDIPLFVCRVSHQGAWYTGKVDSPENGCSIGFRGREMKKSEFDYLEFF